MAESSALMQSCAQRVRWVLTKLAASITKELRLVLRDPHSLAILFVMPLAFVIIMSLALQDFFRDGAAPQFSLAVLDADRGSVARDIIDGVSALPYFRVQSRPSAAPDSDELALRNQVRAGEFRFALLLPPQLTLRHQQALAGGDSQRIMNAAATDRIRLTFIADPTLRADAVALAQTAIERVVYGVEMRNVYTTFTGLPIDPTRSRGMFEIAARTAPEAALNSMPTSTQQNVPAYARLAMFMLVVPLAGTFIKERAQGSLARLRSMPVSGTVVIAGKVLPYFAINLAQLALCLAVGRFVLPWLGAPALQWNGSAIGLVVLASAASLAAIGFALLVAMVAKTIEQATAFGAAAVLLLAALGGIMVPKILMPPALQAVAGWSPMGWALDGFLALFVRAATLPEIVPRAAALLAFSATCFLIALWRFKRLSQVH